MKSLQWNEFYKWTYPHTYKQRHNTCMYISTAAIKVCSNLPQIGGFGPAGMPLLNTSLLHFEDYVGNLTNTLTLINKNITNFNYM